MEASAGTSKHECVLGREKDETDVQVKPLLQPLFGAYVSDFNAEH